MVTQTQLNTAETVAAQLAITIGQLQELIQFAKNQKISGVTIDPTTQAALLAQYSTLKSQLQTQFGTLP